MSYIDCFNHEEVCTVIGMPIYLALQDIDGDEFQCENNTLILGGGGGEHPAMTIKDINVGAKMLLYFDYDNDEFRDATEEDLGLEFWDWTVRTYYRFFQNALLHGYDEDEGYFEYWLLMLITKSIIQTRPELIDSELLNIIQNSTIKEEE